MKLGYDKPLFLVAFDHRASFSRGLFGASEPLPPAVATKVADAKAVIFEAFERAVVRGAPRECSGILVDEQFGAAVAREAKARGFLLAMPAERSGQREFQLQYGAEFGRHIEAFDPDFCKVLVRYNPEGDGALNRRQTERLAGLSEWLHAHPQKFLFELLVPATREQLERCGGDQKRFDRELRAGLVVDAMRELQAGGVEPDIWKIEGLETATDCERVVAQARTGVGREGVVSIVLGRGADMTRVLAWLETAAPVPGFAGFAIGRTLWKEGLERYVAGGSTRAEVRDDIAARFLKMVDAYVESARGGRNEKRTRVESARPADGTIGLGRMGANTSAPEPSDALVFFGATGDLAYKQIFPALQALVRRRVLDAPVVGVARSGWNLDQLRARARDSLEHHGGVDRDAFEKLSRLLRYVDGDYAEVATFERLRRELGAAARPLHYLAIPPSAFSVVVEGLAHSGCAAHARVAVEKPFGRDLDSARELNRTLHAVFPESSIFRIDHYLGKEPVLNLLYFRFANLALESVLDREHVDNVQITMAERFGVQGRGRFYEETGAIRDVLQNHVLQLVAILAMDPPVGEGVEAIRDEKARILKAIAPLDADHVVRGQFRGYRDEPGVARASTVETFAAARLHIESWRWAGVPFFVRAGKCLAANAIELRVELKRPPCNAYPDTGRSSQYFRFRVGPEITAQALGMRVKRPGEAMVGRDVELLASEDQARDMLPYERLLGDALRGDASLFAREDAIGAQWRIVQPVLDLEAPPHPYEPGSWGPTEADRLVATVGGWRKPVDATAALAGKRAA